MSDPNQSDQSYYAAQSGYEAYDQSSGASYEPSSQNACYQPASGPASAPTPPVKRSGGGFKSFVFAFIGAALACLLVLALTGNLFRSSTQAVLGGNGTSFEVVGEDASLAEAVASKVIPSVVCIYAFGVSNSNGTSSGSLGSGVILSQDGYIITNNHVIDGANNLTVSLANEDVPATVVGTDPSSDLAVIKVDRTDLTPIDIGVSSELKVGEWVMAVGTPYGMESSVSTGIVSATSRTSTSLQNTGSGGVYTNMIQTDAAINPGNSGGALVNSSGQLIGINTMIASSSGASSGVGFAIPSDYAISIAQQIIEGGTPTHAQLGVTLVSVNETMAEAYGLPVTSGAYVTSVVANSGAAQAGIQEGDIIVGFDGEAVTSSTGVIVDVRSKNPGDQVTIKVVRDNQEQEFNVTLGSDN